MIKINSKDYKAIAELCKRLLEGDIDKIYFIKQLVNHFEREDNKKEITDGVKYGKYKQFNRKQFLKRCGVE